jgi:hypothetical protein
MSTQNLFAALVRAQASARAVGLDSKNEHHRYRYASAESLIEEGRSALVPAGLALLVTDVALDCRAPIPVDEENTQTGEVRRRFVPQPTMLRATYVLAHESGESISYVREWPALEQKGRPIDKAEGGALTTALGYAIRDVLMLPRDDDYADMDRRDDRDHKPANDVRREEPRREPKPEPQREQPAAAAPERTVVKDEPPFRTDDQDEWTDLIERIKRGESVGQQLERSTLPLTSRLAIAYVSRAWKAADEQAFTKIGAEIRKSEDLIKTFRPEDDGRPLSQVTLDLIKPAWGALQERTKRLREAEAAGLEKAS